MVLAVLPNGKFEFVAVTASFTPSKFKCVAGKVTVTSIFALGLSQVLTV